MPTEIDEDAFWSGPPPYEGTEAEWIAWGAGLAVPAALGCEYTELFDGRCTLVIEESPWPLNLNGSLNGALVMGAVDQAAGAVAATVMKPGELPATITITTEFRSAVFPPATIRAEVTRRTRALAFVTMDVYDREKRLAVHATGVMSANRLNHSPRPTSP